MPADNQFEAPRGVTEVSVSPGFAQVKIHVGRQDVVAARIEALRVLAEAGISHKYLQLTPEGLALIIRDDQVFKTKEALAAAKVNFELNEKRSLVLVSAPGIWEEKGVIASIMEAAIRSGVEVDHVGDMHDRMYMVIAGDVAVEAADRFRAQLLGGPS
jgi:aspartokinase